MKNIESGFLHVPIMDDYFKKRRKNEALMWIPVQCSLLFCDELQHLCTSTKYIYVAFMLICGNRGSNEIPFNISYLARMAGVDRRTMSKGIDELLCAKMLHKRERKIEKKEEKSRDSTESEIAPNGGAVRVDLKNSFQDNSEKTNSEKINSSEDEIKKSLLKIVPNQNLDDKNKRSQFSIEECLKYVEICQTKGEQIKNAKGLANHLYKTGEADAFILSTLYPKQQEEIDRDTYGEPRQFSADEPCSVCFGAKMANPDGAGFRPCEHCRNERGKATGWEPLESSAS